MTDPIDINYVQITDDITAILGAATGMVRAQSYNQLTDGMTDYPTIQVYWSRDVTDPSGTTHATTFQGGVQQTETIIHADLYARQRAHMAEDMAALYTIMTAVRRTLEAQLVKPYFGNAQIKAFRWAADRVTFEYGEPSYPYVGTRYTLTLRIF